MSEYSLTTRAAIVTLRSQGRGWVYISQQLTGVSPNGAQACYQRTAVRARSTELRHLLDHLGTRPRSGRPPRSGMASTTLRDLSALSSLELVATSSV